MAISLNQGDICTEDSGIDYNNTTIVIENGMITTMNRVFTP